MRKFLKKLKTTDLSSSAKNKKQPQFPFLSLPAEIRNRIYFFLFDCSTGIHLVHHEDKIFHIRCQQASPPPLLEPDISPCCCGEVVSQARRSLQYFGTAPNPTPRHGDIFVSTPSSNGKQPLSPLPTSILYTSHQISTEALSILYSSLRFFQTDNLKTWILFANSIPQSHLSLIKSLRATYIGLPCLTMAPVRPPSPSNTDPPSTALTGYPAYERYTTSPAEYLEFWEVVRTRMPGLRELGFVMDYDGQFLARGKGAEWVRPVKEVRGLSRVRVAVWDRIRGEDGKGEGVERARREEGELNGWLREWVCRSGEE